MTLAVFNRRLSKLSETGNRLMDVSTYGMTNTQRDTHERKVRRNNDAVRNLCQAVSEETYNASLEAANLCCEWSEWQY